ncbi:MAG: ABC transporter ATP-binding protein [Gammaproteobacteria bacterium]|nr:ABC transporter ATP-binding protein [Gammaproteobacteria bacterium]
MNTNVITLSNIRKRYQLGDSTVDALCDVDLSVNKGELVALEGPSGSGKSTLLNICGLLDTADSGEFFLSGNPVATLSDRRRADIRRNQIGFIFQSFNLVPVMSAFENIEYPLLLAHVSSGQRRQRVNAMLKRVGLDGFAGHLPDKLSGGQRQRVAIARALVKQPTLVIADEPTASLDTHTAEEVIGIMRELSQQTGASFLIATHDARMSSHCARRITLRDGRLQ